MSSSSSSVSRLGFGLEESGGEEEEEGGGSQEAMRRWDLARARAVRLVSMEAADSGVRAEGGAGVIGVIGGLRKGGGGRGVVFVGMFWLYD